MDLHDRAMMNMAARAQFDAMTGGDAIQVCRRHPILVKRLQQWAMRWLARGSL